MSNTTPIWDTLTNKYNVNFDLPQNHTSNLHRNPSLLDTLESAFEDKNNKSISNELLPLLSVSCANKMDISQLLLTQYQLSNLSFNEFISRSSLLNEIRSSTTKHTVLNMLSNYIKSYNKYICNPLPASSDELPCGFQAYNDTIDIILQYMMRINRINEHNLIQARPAQFDVYFVPPNVSHNFASFYVPRMRYSVPTSRVNYRSGLNDLYSLFCSESAQKLMNGLNTGKKRLILLIVRSNEYDTNGDLLYLYSKDIISGGDLRSAEYENNEVLWNLNSKQDYPYYFNISYHFHNKCNRIYMYYNGFGQQISKNVIFDKLSLIFADMDGKNKISKQIFKALNAEKHGFNDFISSDKSFEFGQYLFGLKYQRRRFIEAKRRLLHIPRSVIANDVVQIREFDDPRNQLYYYLTWTCKMQVIDGEFSEYTLPGDKQIAIFNSELHEKHSNNILYVVANLNKKHAQNDSKPKWNMHNMMTSHQIYQSYHINSTDLPFGSRYIHNYFQPEMTQNNLNLNTNIFPINNWNKVPIIFSQTFGGDCKPNFNNLNLNQRIKQSITAIRSNQNVSLIPILRIDSKKNSINCDTLIPIELSNKHIALSYKILNNNIVINAIYIDAMDIIKKAALVDANAVNTYKYLCNDTLSLTRCELKQNWSTSSNSSHDSNSVASVTDQSWVIQSLQEQLNSALKRENILMNMLTTPNDIGQLKTNINTTGNININNNNTYTPQQQPQTFSCNFSQIPSPSISPLALNSPNTQSLLSSPVPLLSVNGIGAHNNYTCNNPIIHANPITFPSFISVPISTVTNINPCLINQFPLLQPTVTSPACMTSQ